MNLETLVTGIARGNTDDLKEYYGRTSRGVYVFALACLKDRFLARDAAVESYRRVIKEAYLFDSSMSAELWHLEFVKNLCTNGLCDGGIAAVSAKQRRDNISGLLEKALFGTYEDRGKIIALRCGTGLGNNQIAGLLRYNAASCAGEFRRGIVQAAKEAGLEEKDRSAIRNRLEEDIAAACPDYYELIGNGGENAFSNINCTDLWIREDEAAEPGETQEKRLARVEGKRAQKRKKAILAVIICAAAVVLLLGAAAAVHFAKSGRTLIKDPDEETQEIVEPQYRTDDPAVAVGDKLYFANYADGGKLWAFDLKDGTKKAVADVIPKDFSEPSAEGTVYFRDSAKGEICKLSADGTVTSTGIKGALPVVTGDGVFFSSKTGVSLLTVDGEVVDIFQDTAGTAYRFDMHAAPDSIIFSAAPSEGLYRLTKTDADSYYCDNAMTGYVIYAFELYGDYIVFDDGNGNLYCVNMQKGTDAVATVKGKLKTGAFCVNDGVIYYYGTAENDDTDAVRAVTVENAAAGKVPEKLFVPEVKKSDLADIYVKNGNVFCYFSNGDKNKPLNELRVYKGAAEPGTDATAQVIYSRKKK